MQNLELRKKNLNHPGSSPGQAPYTNSHKLIIKKPKGKKVLTTKFTKDTKPAEAELRIENYELRKKKVYKYGCM